jgi:hypothetical protein
MTTNTFDTFDTYITNIFQIMENPNSYITTDTNQLSNKMSNILSELMSTHKINSTQEQITEQHIPQIVNNLKNIMPLDMNIDYSDLLDYFKTVEQFKSNSICKCYVRPYDDEDLDDCGEEIIKSSVIFKNVQCKTCGYFESDHKVCTKYIHTDDYWCENCGLGQDLHAICMNYNGIDEDCTSCGISWRNHQDKMDTMNIDDCNNFMEHPECKNRCVNCVFNKNHHRYSKKYHLLNKNAQHQITDLWFSLTSDFISMTEEVKLKYYTGYMSINRILTKPL